MDATHLRTGFTEVKGGKIFWEMRGRGNPLILIHGGLLNRHIWESQTNEFAKKYRVLSYDLRGCGSSLGRGSYNDNLDDLERLMSELELEEAALIGLSLGARIALDFARQKPARIRALVLVSPGLSGYTFARDITQEMLKMVQAVQKGDLSTAIDTYIKLWVDGQKGRKSAARGRVKEILSDFNWEEFLTPTPQREEKEPVTAGKLHSIRIPTLIMVGTRDKHDILEIAAILKRGINGTRLKTFPGCAHMVNMEKPKEFNKEILDFLDAVQY